MFILLSQYGSVSFEDTDDFSRFKIVSELPQSNLEAIVSALQGLAVVESAERVWVSAVEMGVRSGRDTDQAWCAKFEQMIEGSRPYGYIRDNPTMIAGHIEWALATSVNDKTC